MPRRTDFPSIDDDDDDDDDLGIPEEVVRERQAKIGARIREMRLHRDMTLAELAKRSEVSEARLSEMENGDLDEPMETLNRIAAALDTSSLFFFTVLADDPYSKALDELRHLPSSEVGEEALKVVEWAKANHLFPFDGSGKEN